jgi:hypothetical protein
VSASAWLAEGAVALQAMSAPTVSPRHAPGSAPESNPYSPIAHVLITVTCAVRSRRRTIIDALAIAAGVN